MNCGIYKIINSANGKVYVGSSTNLVKRWNEHSFFLNNNYNKNPHLQNAWNKYGGDSFVFEVLLYCDKENLVFYEQRAMDEYKSLDGEFGYNIRPARRNDLTGSNYDKWVQNLSDNHSNRKFITINGKYYGTIKEAALFFGLSHQALNYRLKNGIDPNKKASTKGKNNYQARAITINNKYYNTLVEASQDLGIKLSTLKSRLKNGIDINKPIKSGRSKSITINGKYYNSRKEAAQDLGIPYHRLKNGIIRNK